MLSTLLSLVFPLGMKFVIDDVIAARKIGVLPLVIAATLAASFSGGLLELNSARVYALITQGVFKDVRLRMFDHMCKLNLAYFAEEKAGSVASRMITDVEGLRTITANAFMSAFNDSILLMVTSAGLIYMNKPLAILSLATVTLSGIFCVKLGKDMRAISKDNLENLGQLSGNISETFNGIKTIRLFANEPYHLEKFTHDAQKAHDLGVKLITRGALAKVTISWISMFGPSLVLGYGGWQVYQGNMSLGSLVAFFAMLSRLYSPANGLAQLNITVRTALASTERILDFLDEPIEENGVGKKTAQISVPSSVRFSDVCFAYLEDGPPVVEKLSFEIKAGETVALLGYSGAGKTTLVELFAALHRVSSGKIEINGVSIDKLDVNALRKSIAFVAQDTFLFFDSIATNIAYSNRHAQDSEIIDAAKAARAHDFILRLPDGYASRVGERGAKLSGGQKQRIAIARALLARRPILILDEATNSIDRKSETLIWQSIKRLYSDKIIIMITHRLRVTDGIDRIIWLANGQLVKTAFGSEVRDLYKEYESSLTEDSKVVSSLAVLETTSGA